MADTNQVTSVVFDADVLIKLAQHPANIDAIRAIKKAIHRGTYNFLVLEPVQNAFNREKQRAADAYWSIQRSYVKNFRQLRDVLSMPKEIPEFADRLSVKIDAHVSGVPDTITEAESLLAKGEHILTKDVMKVAAADRIIQRKPPAAKAENSSINDCIIWEMVKERVPAGELIFVTDNYSDFSDPFHREKLHPELLTELEAASKFCYHSLEGFRKKHMKEVQIVVPPASTICPACHYQISPQTIARPSQYGGWTYQLYCGNCGIYIDTGDPYDE